MVVFPTYNFEVPCQTCVKSTLSVSIFITIQTYKNIINEIRIKSIRTSRHILFLLYIFLGLQGTYFSYFILFLDLGAYNYLDWKIEHASKSNDQHLTYMFNWRDLHYAIIIINFVFGYYHVHAELKATAILTRLEKIEHQILKFMKSSIYMKSEHNKLLVMVNWKYLESFNFLWHKRVLYGA